MAADPAWPGSAGLRTAELAGGMTVLLPPVPGVVFTTRLGGVSPDPFASLNLSGATGDDPGCVAANRRRLSAVLGIGQPWVTARQVHGCSVGLATGSAEAPLTADALVVCQPGLAVAVLVADCVPIALTGAGVAGAIHAGWRGLCRGVIGAAVAQAARLSPGALTGWIGPCIGPCCFEVGAEVVDAFAAAYPGAPGCTQMVAGRLHFDLPAAAAFALEAAGVTVGNPAGGPCTMCDRRFYSHRRATRSGTSTGRQALLAWRQAS